MLTSHKPLRVVSVQTTSLCLCYLCGRKSYALGQLIHCLLLNGKAPFFGGQTTDHVPYAVPMPVQREFQLVLLFCPRFSGLFQQASQTALSITVRVTLKTILHSNWLTEAVLLFCPRHTISPLTCQLAFC